MERTTIALLAATVLAFAGPAMAQPRTDRAAPPAPPSQNVQISDADLETFADIYVDLRETAEKFEAELAAAGSEDEALKVQSRMQEESVEKVTRRGWTPERYVATAQTINADPALADKTLALIDDRI
jgi:hypothetical protein